MPEQNAADGVRVFDEGHVLMRHIGPKGKVSDVIIDSKTHTFVAIPKGSRAVVLTSDSPNEPCPVISAAWRVPFISHRDWSVSKAEPRKKPMPATPEGKMVARILPKSEAAVFSVDGTGDDWRPVEKIDNVLALELPPHVRPEQVLGLMVKREPQPGQIAWATECEQRGAIDFSICNVAMHIAGVVVDQLSIAQPPSDEERKYQENKQHAWEAYCEEHGLTDCVLGDAAPHTNAWYWSAGYDTR